MTSVRLRSMQRGLVALLVLLAAACEPSPSGRQQLALVPQPMLDDMGRAAFAEMLATRPQTDDAEATQHVQCVTASILAAASARYPDMIRPSEWVVAVFTDPSPNAFAMPGHRIGVHTGMFDVASTDDQLAAVLGHEVGHVLARHSNERMTQQLGLNAVLLLIALFAEVDSQFVLEMLGVGAHLGITLPFSRIHETEADLVGLELMALAGFDPAHSIALWQNMGERSEGQPEFLSTHPGHDTRISDLQANMAQAQEIYSGAQRVDCYGAAAAGATMW